MNEATIRKELSQLKRILTERHAVGQAKMSLDGLYIPSGSTEKQDVEEFVADLRVLLKYVVFDLEATRRENRYLRQMLETRNKRDQDRGSGSDLG